MKKAFVRSASTSVATPMGTYAAAAAACLAAGSVAAARPRSSNAPARFVKNGARAIRKNIFKSLEPPSCITGIRKPSNYKARAVRAEITGCLTRAEQIEEFLNPLNLCRDEGE